MPLFAYSNWTPPEVFSWSCSATKKLSASSHSTDLQKKFHIILNVPFTYCRLWFYFGVFADLRMMFQKEKSYFGKFCTNDEMKWIRLFLVKSCQIPLDIAAFSLLFKGSPYRYGFFNYLYMYVLESGNRHFATELHNWP